MRIVYRVKTCSYAIFRLLRSPRSHLHSEGPTPSEFSFLDFDPLADSRARVLVLGSLPGRKSLEMHEYYAQPYNAFWRIMGALFGAERALPYGERVERLRANGVAVWDVLAAGERDGSLNSAIVSSTIVVNDFNGFFAQHREIR